MIPPIDSIIIKVTASMIQKDVIIALESHVSSCSLRGLLISMLIIYLYKQSFRFFALRAPWEMLLIIFPSGDSSPASVNDCTITSRVNLDDVCIMGGLCDMS